MAFCTRSWVSTFTARVRLSTWDTVDMDTPATRATSDIVTISHLHSWSPQPRSPTSGPPRREYPGYIQALAQALVCALRCHGPQEFGRRSPDERPDWFNF